MRLRDVQVGAPTGVALLALVLAYGGAVGVTRAAAQNGPAPTTNPVASTPASIAAGQRTYQRYCRGCHGSTGQGGPQGEGSVAPSNLVDATWDHGSSDPAIFTVIKLGIGPDYAMEAWGDRISDPEIWEVVNYLRSLARQQ